MGSVASVGITIAQNIVGGIDKYLEQNKEFLKQKLVSIFDITGDIALLIGEACAAVAYIFEAFGSENGQQLTANVIGIFANAFLGAAELAMKFGRDVLDAVITPISENKEALRTALEGFLGVLAEIAGDIKARIEEAFENLNQLYDENVKPVLDDMSKKFSEWIANDLVQWIDDLGQSWKKAFDWIFENEGVIASLVINVLLLKAAWDLLNGAFTAFHTAAPIVTGALTTMNTLLSGGLLSGVGTLSKLVNVFALVAGGAGTLNEALVLMFGTSATMFAGIAAIVGGVITAVTNFVSMLQNGFNWINETLMVVGIGLMAIGAVILGAPALVAAAVAGIVAAIATIVVVIHDNWEAICAWFSGVADWINANVIQPVIGFFKGVWTSVSGFFANLWGDIRAVWGAVSSWFNEHIITPVVGFFVGFATRVGQIFEGLWIIIQAVWIIVSEWFGENVVTPIMELFTFLWDGIVEIWSVVAEWFNENVIIPVVAFFQSVWESVSGFFASLWEDIKVVWAAVSGWFEETVITPVRNAFETVCKAIGGFFESLWKGIKGGVVSAMNAVIGAIESAINFIIDAVNRVLEGFNRAVAWAAEVAGADWKGVDLVQKVALSRIPALASGAVIRGGNPFMAILGDQPRGVTNIETPLPTMVQAFKQAISETGWGGGRDNVPVNINVVYDGEVTARVMIPNILAELGRQGYNVEVLGVT